MTWSRISKIFNSAVNKTSAARRDYLERVEDPALRQQVESLLKQSGGSDSLFNKPAQGGAAHVVGVVESSDLTGDFPPYQLIERIGGGGMGDVYLAHDQDLKRNVAIKLLPVAFQEDRNRLARFDREARVLAALKHPNIAPIHALTEIAGRKAIVLELMDEMLSEPLTRGRLALHDVLSFARQIADALEAAHEKGIIHRDLKPANVALTGNPKTVKVLDFGLAKTAEADGVQEASDGRTLEGMIIGTPAYMSPEQARGQPIDKRTDIWAFGCVVYEMLAGEKAFRGDTAPDILSAVLNSEPDWSALPAATPPNIRRLVERCLEKDPRHRLHDIADARLEVDDALTGRTMTQSDRKTVSRGWRAAAVVAALLMAGTATAVFFTRPAPPTFTLLSFQRGRIGGARFASNGTAAVYSAANEGRPLDVIRVDLEDDSPSPRSLNYPAGSDVLAVRGGDVALSLRRRFVLGERFVGTLATAPLGGGAPRPLESNIEDADWDPTGRLAVVRSSGDSLRQSTLEFPVGRVLYKTTGSLRFLRVSRDGQRLAFLEDLGGRGVSGHVSVAYASGRVTRVTSVWGSVRGLAWSASGDEIWFTAGEARANRILRAVDLNGRERVVFEAPGSLTLWDIAADGRVLLSRDEERRSVVAMAPGESAERDLSLFDDAGVSDISDDGRWVLCGDRSIVYLRPTDGSEAIHLLNEGFADAISPDGTQVLATVENQRTLMVVATGSGSRQPLPKSNIAAYRGARWFPDGSRVFFTGSEPGRDSRTFIQDLSGGLPIPFTPEGIRALAVSPAGDTLAVEGREQVAGSKEAEGSSEEITLWPVDGGSRRSIPGSRPGDRPVVWSQDARSMWVFHQGEVPAPVFKLDIATGQRELWKMLLPLDPAGVYSITQFRITPSGNAYAYTYTRLLSQLYLVRGLS
jgi:Tol biopolymer transport system component